MRDKANYEWDAKWTDVITDSVYDSYHNIKKQRRMSARSFNRKVLKVVGIEPEIYGSTTLRILLKHLYSSIKNNSDVLLAEE
jgi:hypothetical protein